MRHEARLSSAVPHSTAFLPPAFIAMLPPMHDASAEVGSTANTKPARSAASATRWVTTPASVQTVATARVDARQRDVLDLGHRLELLGVDDRARPGQRHRAAGVAGAAAARDDGQAELDAARDQAGHLGLGVGREHDERILDAPVGRVGDVRDARQAVELDVVLGGDAARARARCGVRRSPDGAKLRRERCRPPRARACSSSPTDGVALGVGAGRAALLDLAQAVVQRLDQQARGGAGCRAGRPAGRDCAARPRCRPAPRTACAPSGRCGARRAACRAPPRHARRAGGSRSRGRRTRCSCRESRAAAARRLPLRRRRRSRSAAAVRSWRTGARRGRPARSESSYRSAANRRAARRHAGLSRRVIPLAAAAPGAG